MLKKLPALFAGLLLTLVAAAVDDSELRPGHPDTYTVKRGDTLWGIANTYGVTLTALLNVNPQIKNPNRIAVGERVTLP